MLDALHNTQHYLESIGRCDRVSPTNPEFYADCQMGIWVATALGLSYTCRKSRNLIQVNTNKLTDVNDIVALATPPLGAVLYWLTPFLWQQWLLIIKIITISKPLPKL